MKIDKNNIIKKEFITVEFFYENVKDLFNVKLMTPVGVGFKKHIYDQNLHRPGLALAGFVDLFTYNRIQLIGNTENRYCLSLSPEKRDAAIANLLSFDVPAMMLSNANEPCDELIKHAIINDVAVFQIGNTSTKTAYLIGDFLEDQFGIRVSLHGSFLDVYGIGMLFVGKSGIGKSEVALDLVERGHRLVADDVVILTKKGEHLLIGTGTDVIQHVMEIRGIGIIDVQHMFGVRSIRHQKRLEIVIELEIWDENTEYTRTGLDNETISILDIDIPYLKLPIFPGKNITVIAETIALNYLSAHYGYNAAKELQERLQNKINGKNRQGERAVNYFEHDEE